MSIRVISSEELDATLERAMDEARDLVRKEGPPMKLAETVGDLQLGTVYGVDGVLKIDKL